MQSSCTLSMRAAAEGLLAGFATMDRDMADHCRRGSGVAGGLARAAGLSVREITITEVAGLLHDIGKFRVPARILRKPGPLTPGERSLIQEHSEMGSEIVSRVGALRSFAAAVPHPHERWDGTGYPGRLAGEEIPFVARIIAVVDAWDAMVQPRGYAPTRSIEEARAEILRGAGSQFDPALAELFVHEVVDERVDRALLMAA